MDIKVLKVEPGKNPEETFLSTDIRSIQEAVSIGAPGRCFFQTVYLEKNVVLLCNDAGKLIGLEGNRRIGRDIIAGVFYITECDSDGNLMSISDKNLLFYKIIFWKPENEGNKNAPVGENANFFEKFAAKITRCSAAT